MSIILLTVLGFLVLIAFLLGGRFMGDLTKGARWFIPVWLLIALIGGGLPAGLVVFGLPALLAGLLWFKGVTARHR